MMRSRYYLSGILLAVVAILLLTHPAQAQLDLTLQSPVTVTPGGTATFIATLSNPVGGNEIFLTGLDITPSDPSLTGDPSPFANYPLSLVGGDSVTAPLFNVIVANDATPGMYSGIVTVLGGPNSGDVNQVTEPVSFTVNVTPAPEPESLGLLLAAGIGVAFLIRQRLRHGKETVIFPTV
jgi:hypothetical protein